MQSTKLNLDISDLNSYLRRFKHRIQVQVNTHHLISTFSLEPICYLKEEVGLRLLVQTNSHLLPIHQLKLFLLRPLPLHPQPPIQHTLLSLQNHLPV